MPDGGESVDDGMAVVFRAPASFTGEDTVEIYCHGGVLVTSTVLTAAFAAGAVAGAGGIDGNPRPLGQLQQIVPRIALGNHWGGIFNLEGNFHFRKFLSDFFCRAGHCPSPVRTQSGIFRSGRFCRRNCLNSAKVPLAKQLGLMARYAFSWTEV